jgi:hypothetical protein
MSLFNMEPHPKDGKLVDETPNRVVDEEGFVVAQFRFYNDAKAYVEAVNSNFPCAEYSIEGEEA